MPNTGTSGNGVLAYEADGYEWSFPTDQWTGSSNEFIIITPVNGCAGGSIKVRGYINCFNGRSYSNWSQDLPLRIINNPGITVNSQSSFTLQCGSTSTVRFTSTAYSCAMGYTWEFPAGWRAGSVTSPITTPENYIDLTPLPTPANAGLVTGSVKVTAHLGCNNYKSPDLQFKIEYADPGLASPVFTTATPSLFCSGNSATASVNAVAGASLYKWYTSSIGTVYINGIVHNSSNPLTTSSPDVTVSVPVTSSRYAVMLHVEAAQSNQCKGSLTKSKDLWVGSPLLAAQYSDEGLVRFTNPTDPLYYNNVPNLIEKRVDMTSSGAQGSWSRIAANPTNTTWSVSNDQLRFYFFQVGQTATFRYTSANTCGSISQDYSFKSVSSSGGGCNHYSVSPNPSSSAVEIVAPNIPAPCGTAPYAASSLEQSESSLTISTVDVYTLDGQLRYSKRFEDKPKMVTLDLKELRNGVYILKISGGTLLETHRIHIR